MADPLPPDPYAALGVARDADAAAIKSAYRKLALKYHPDKAKGKEAEFHKIQSAFEVIGDDESRRKYDDSYYLETMRQQRRGSRPNVDIRTAAFDMRSNSTAGATFTTRGPARYEERRPKHSYDDDYRFFEPEDNRASSRKQSGVGSTPRKPSSRSSKTTDDIRRDSKDEKVSPKERAERKKQRDRDTVRERERKYAYAEDHFSESDDATYERERERRRVYERGSPRSTHPEDESWVKYHIQASDLKDYISRARAEALATDPGAPPPPPPQATARSPSFKDPDVEVRRTSKDARPSFVKRSSTRSTKEKAPEPVRRSSAPQRRATSKEADMEYETRRPQPPPLQTHLSSGSVPHSRESRRSKTEAEHDAPRPARLSRAETMPTQRSTNRRGDTTPVTSSNLRHSETHDSGYSTSSPSETPPPPSFHKSHTFTAGDYLDVEEYTTAFREPSSRSRQRSPEELPRSHATTARRQPTTSSPRTASYDEPEPVRTTPRAPRRSSTDTSPRMPSLQRGQTMPLPRTGRAGAGLNPDLLPYEIPRTTSPTEFTSTSRTAGYRATSDDIQWTPSYSSDDVKYANLHDLREPVRRSSANAEGLGSRSSKDGAPREFTRRSSTDHDRVRAARDYIAQAGRDAAFRPAMRKTPTTAY